MVPRTLLDQMGPREPGPDARGHEAFELAHVSRAHPRQTSELDFGVRDGLKLLPLGLRCERRISRKGRGNLSVEGARG